MAVEEDRRGLEAKVARLTVERTSLLLELETSRDEVYALHSQANNVKEAMVEDYQPWSTFSLMATDAMCSNMASSVTVQGFQMAYLTLPTHFLQSFL